MNDDAPNSVPSQSIGAGPCMLVLVFVSVQARLLPQASTSPLLICHTTDTLAASASGPLRWIDRLASSIKARRGSEIPHQSIEILIALLEHPGELVGREDLRRRLWADHTFVDFEHGLNAAIRRLRAALGDSADTPRFIETLPRRGYRFIGSCDPRTGVQDRLSGDAAARDAVRRARGGISTASRDPERDDRRVKRERPPADRSSQIRSLVVLPFTNGSGAGMSSTSPTG